MSRRPKASRTARVTARVSFSSATSHSWAIALPPAIATRSAVSLAPARLMSQQATAAPASAKAIEIARPMPPAAPLTSAVLPVSFIQHSSQSSQHYRSAIDRNGLTGNQRRRVGHQPQRGADNIRWGEGSLDRLADLDHVECAVELVAKKLLSALGHDSARRQGVYPDSIAP